MSLECKKVHTCIHNLQLVSFQICVILCMTSWMWTMIMGEQLLLSHLPCRALVTREKVLGTDGVGQFLLAFNLNAKLPEKLVAAYQKKADKRGESCLGNMTEALTVNLDSFGQKVNRMLNEQKMTALYLSDSRFVGRGKRFEIGTLSLLLSVLSFFISTTGLVVNGLRLNNVEDRLTILSQHIDEMRETQKSVVNNLEYLYESNNFIGIEKDLLVDYVNGVKSVYSCDFLKIYFDSISVNFNSFLEKLLSAASNRKLVHELLNRDSLDEVTTHHYFKESIFLVNPSLLYTLASMDLVSYKNGIVTFMISFPYIRRKHEFKTVELIEAPRKLLLQKSNFKRLHSFMIPVDLPLESIIESASHMRTMDNCILTRSFTACDGNSLLGYEDRMCLLSLMTGIDTHCYTRDVPVFDFNVEYSEQYALVYLRNNTSIVDSKKKQTLYKTNDNEEKCLLLNKRTDLVVKSIFRTEKLFPYKQLVTFRVESKNLEFTHTMEPNVIGNFTRPTFNRTKSYVPIVLKTIVDSKTVQTVAIVLSSIVLLIILIAFIVRFGNCKRRQTVEGNELFPTQGGK